MTRDDIYWWSKVNNLICIKLRISNKNTKYKKPQQQQQQISDHFNVSKSHEHRYFSKNTQTYHLRANVYRFGVDFDQIAHKMIQKQQHLAVFVRIQWWRQRLGCYFCYCFSSFFFSFANDIPTSWFIFILLLHYFSQWQLNLLFYLICSEA